uniref:Uncharacterized protein n=1 Tax=Phalaenopsis aphrodite subsp. formosana TaxID=308872 RepID=Q3BAH5_PHAAO|nr:hypothetical protein PhapfoPp102 [Phalaenopsis aphrodite subsp. formosana]AAW82575.1 hypothetical protein [Phalaenopsis aphrodite subsp. formosana]
MGFQIKIFVNRAILIVCLFKVQFILCFFLSINLDLFRFIYFVQILLFFRTKGRFFFGGFLLFLFSLLHFISCFYIIFFLYFSPFFRF